MDERKALRQRYFDDLSSEWNRIFPPEELGRLTGLLGNLGLEKGDRVLDVGCGTGRLAGFLLDRVQGLGRVIGIDISLGMVKRAGQTITDDRARFILADAECLPFAEEWFDAVICFAAFPHLDAKERALAEFRRVTRPGGILVILHLMGRDEVNRLHQQLPGVVSEDLLPEVPEMRRLAEKGGYDEVKVENRPDLLLLYARRPL